MASVGRDVCGCLCGNCGKLGSASNSREEERVNPVVPAVRNSQPIYFLSMRRKGLFGAKLSETPAEMGR